MFWIEVKFKFEIFLIFWNFCLIVGFNCIWLYNRKLNVLIEKGIGKKVIEILNSGFNLRLVLNKLISIFYVLILYLYF